jgi:membrane protease YdiL (CAAX protease family)
MTAQTQQFFSKFEFREEKNLNKASEFNLITFILSGLAIIGMLTIYIIFRNSGFPIEREYAKYSILMLCYAITGVISLNLYKNKQFALFPINYKPFVSQNVFYAFLLFGILVIIQVIYEITQIFFSPNTLLEINYIIFSAVCEELFFRGCVLGFFIYIAKGKKKSLLLIGLLLSTGLFVSSFLFAKFHTNYTDPIFLVVIMIGGILLGISYIVKKDIMIPILAHFFLNCYTAIALYFQNLSIGG